MFLGGSYALLALANIGGLVRIASSGLELDWWETLNAAANLDKWQTLWFPPDGVEGKTILNVGARCGADTWFYFKKGAKKVIAIEPDQKCVKILRDNAAKFGWDIDILDRGVKLSDFEMEYDFAKVNAEGYEMVLLEGPVKLKPMAVETHCDYITNKFKDIGFRILDGPYEYLGRAIMVNYP
jgi:hypothetical protein